MIFSVCGYRALRPNGQFNAVLYRCPSIVKKQIAVKITLEEIDLKWSLQESFHCQNLKWNVFNVFKFIFAVNIYFNKFSVMLTSIGNV